MKPICVPCQRFYKPVKTGYYFIEGMPTAEWDHDRGKHSKGWTPYKVCVGDLYECPDCHSQIVTGFGQNHLAEHYEPNFHQVVRKTHADQLMVKDC